MDVAASPARREGSPATGHARMPVQTSGTALTAATTLMEEWSTDGRYPGGQAFAADIASGLATLARALREIMPRNWRRSTPRCGHSCTQRGLSRAACEIDSTSDRPR